jgi:hypothetical protein
MIQHSEELPIRCLGCHRPITIVFVPDEPSDGQSHHCPWRPQGCDWVGALDWSGRVIEVLPGWSTLHRKIVDG